MLASTSVGQEGLDFHPWCHRVVHWNLPSNPVDLEQREGRVHRYKGHAVRRNLAMRHGRAALAGWQHRVERQVPLLPHSIESAAFGRLKRQLAAYRVVFGQPRQEEMLTLLDTSALSPADLQSLTIDLSPPDR